MSRYTVILQRLGGPGAVTWWAFFISLADRLLTVSVQPINLAAPLWVRLWVTVVAQMVMFAPLVLLRFTLLKDPLRPRPWVALAGFALGDVLRALALDQLLHIFGGTELAPALRVFSGFLPTIIPLLVTAYLVNTFRERRLELAALLDVREQLERSRASAEATVQTSNDELVGRVRSVMEAELAALSSQQPGAVVAQLQRTASDVVRPLSHELATSFAARDGAEVESPPVKVGWRQVLGDVALARPLNPVATMVLLSGVWISAGAVFVPVRLAFVVTLPLAILLLVLGNAVLPRLLRALPPLARIGLVLAFCVATGAISGFVMRVLAGTWSSAALLGVAAAMYIAAYSFGMALVNGALAASTAVVEETAVAVGELRRQVVRTRQLRWFHQRGLARALHGPVQSAVTAAALRLDEASRTDAITPAVIDSVRVDLLRTLDVLADRGAFITSYDDGIARIVGTWDGVCSVSSHVDGVAESLLVNDAVTRACVLDIVTDATSNAVRHGHASGVSLSVTMQDHDLVIDVRDDGHAPVNSSGSGLGTSLLDDCALSWKLSKDAAGHCLHVVMPAP